MKTALVALALAAGSAEGFGQEPSDVDCTGVSEVYESWTCTTNDDTSGWIKYVYADDECNNRCAQGTDDHGGFTDILENGFEAALTGCLNTVADIVSYTAEVDSEGLCMVSGYFGLSCDGPVIETRNLSDCHPIEDDDDGDEEDDKEEDDKSDEPDYDDQAVYEYNGLTWFYEALDKDEECTYDMNWGCSTDDVLHFGDNCDAGCNACSNWNAFDDQITGVNEDGSYQYGLTEMMTCVDTGDGYYITATCLSGVPTWYVYLDATCATDPYPTPVSESPHEGCYADYGDSKCTDEGTRRLGNKFAPAMNWKINAFKHALRGRGN